MTPLRLRMTEDMQVRHFSPRTQYAYLHASVAVRPSLRPVTSVAGPRVDSRLPAVPHQPQEDGAQLDHGRESRPCASFTRSPSSEVGTWEQSIPYPKQPRKLPVVASPEEVLRFLDCAPGPQAPRHPDRLLRGGSARVGSGQPTASRHRQPASGHSHPPGQGPQGPLRHAFSPTAGCPA